MFNFILDVLLGCSHKRTTFPLTQSEHSGKRTYVVCLECGKEFDYNWKQMKMAEEGLPLHPGAMAGVAGNHAGSPVAHHVVHQ